MILAIESGSEFISVALGSSRFCSTVTLKSPRNSEELLGVIDFLISTSARNSIEAVAVCIGPGSYTGLRVGLACAQGLASGLEVPLFGVSSFLAGLYLQRLEDGEIDANYLLRVGEVAHCKFLVKDNGRLISQVSPVGCSLSEGVNLNVVNAEGVLKAAAEIVSWGELKGSQSHFVRVTASDPLPLMYLKPVQAKTLIERGLTSAA